MLDASGVGRPVLGHGPLALFDQLDDLELDTNGVVSKARIWHGPSLPNRAGFDPAFSGNSPLMTTGASIFLIAIGAILTWGVTVSNSNGIDVNTIGVILMVIGVLGFFTSMLFFGGFGVDAPMRRRSVGVSRDVIVDDDPTLLRRSGRRVVTRTDEIV